MQTFKVVPAEQGSGKQHEIVVTDPTDGLQWQLVDLFKQAPAAVTRRGQQVVVYTRSDAALVEVAAELEKRGYAREGTALCRHEAAARSSA